jgi:putative hydrolase of the HAD superfamily
MTVAGILFDLDDTLRDWRAAIAEAIEEVADRLDGIQRDEVRNALWAAVERHCIVWRDAMVMDRAYWKLLYDSEHVLSSAALALGEADVSALAEIFRRSLRPPLFADTLPMLEAVRLAHPGVALGILSNNPRASDAIERQGLAGYFETVVGLSPDEGKPRREAFEAGCAALGVEPARCMYVGDSYDNDVLGAAAAGLLSVWLDREAFDYPIPAGAHRITTLAQLVDLIEACGPADS